MKIDQTQAEQIVLRRLNNDPGSEDRFVIIGCGLSPRRDCWIIRANSAAYAETGDFSRMYVGVNAYLIDTDSGAFDYVGSGETIEDFLQDRYDQLEADGRHYVLRCAMDRDDKPGIICLHRLLGCSLMTARQLISEPFLDWLHGRCRYLETAAEMLREQGSAVEIVLNDKITGIPELTEQPYNLDEIQALICSRISGAEQGET